MRIFCCNPFKCVRENRIFEIQNIQKNSVEISIKLKILKIIFSFKFKRKRKNTSFIVGPLSCPRRTKEYLMLDQFSKEEDSIAHGEKVELKVALFVPSTYYMS